MASSPIYKHAFDFLYKWVPTGSGVITNLSWSQHQTTTGVNMSASWYDLYWNSLLSPSPGYSTRHTSSITTKDGTLAWASPAADLLWNVLTPSMSYVQQIQGPTYNTIYRFTYNSESLFRKEFAPVYQFGVLTYPITSSWIAYEPRMIKYASGSTSNGYKIRGDASAYFPATAISESVYSLPSAFVPPTTTYPNVGQNPTMITYSSNSTGSNDGRFFDLAGGCGITRASISRSFVEFAASASGTTPGQIASCSVALKKRRLFFPTVRLTGSVAPTSADIWLALGDTNSAVYTNRANAYFDQNGGIYNVKFTIKRDVTYDYYPDSGPESTLLVYIHDVNKQVPQPVNRIPGANGWYPPENNIVRIKNEPALSFANPATGYLIEQFNINVIQYGTPAQLVFEASGSLASNKYFGCIIDDVEFCKIGVSTDPALIKPATPYQLVEAQQTITLGSG